MSPSLRGAAPEYAVRKGEFALEYLQEVVIYLDPDDAASRSALEFLRAHGVGCTVRDVRADPDLWRDLRFMGAQEVPTVVVNGIAVEGFRPETLREVLGLSS